MSRIIKKRRLFNNLINTICTNKKNLLGSFGYTLAMACLSPGLHMYVFHLLNKDFLYKEFHTDIFFMTIALLVDAVKLSSPKMNNKEIKFISKLSFFCFIVSGVILSLCTLIYGVVMYDILLSNVQNMDYSNISLWSYFFLVCSILFNFLSAIKQEASTC